MKCALSQVLLPVKFVFFVFKSNYTFNVLSNELKIEMLFIEMEKEEIYF